MEKVTIKDSSITLPDGKYQAVWCGYVVNINHNGDEIVCDCDSGIRGMSSITIYVQDGEIIIGRG